MNYNIIAPKKKVLNGWIILTYVSNIFIKLLQIRFSQIGGKRINKWIIFKAFSEILNIKNVTISLYRIEKIS